MSDVDKALRAIRELVIAACVALAAGGMVIVGGAMLIAATFFILFSLDQGFDLQPLFNMARDGALVFGMGILLMRTLSS